MAKYQSTILVTGGTSGLGYEAALAIAKTLPDTEVVICSRTDKTNAAQTINQKLQQSNVVFKRLDLADQAQIRKFAADWSHQNHAPLQALVLNAALQFPATEPTYTKDGIEATFGITNVGHALLFYLMRPHLSSDCRIVMTSSGTHDPAQKTGVPEPRYISAEDLAHPSGDSLKIKGMQRYSTSKLCNVLWTYALDRHLKELQKTNSSNKWTATAMDPGAMPDTSLTRAWPWPASWIIRNVLGNMLWLSKLMLGPNVHMSKESGAALARLAIAKEFRGVSGKYFEGNREIKSSVISYSQEKQDDLWTGTIKLIAQDDVEMKSFADLS